MSSLMFYDPNSRNRLKDQLKKPLLVLVGLLFWSVFPRSAISGALDWKELMLLRPAEHNMYTCIVISDFLKLHRDVDSQKYLYWQFLV